jgi:hypothetical protein
MNFRALARSTVLLIWLCCFAFPAKTFAELPVLFESIGGVLDSVREGPAIETVTEVDLNPDALMAGEFLFELPGRGMLKVTLNNKAQSGQNQRWRSIHDVNLEVFTGTISLHGDVPGRFTASVVHDGTNRVLFADIFTPEDSYTLSRTGDGSAYKLLLQPQFSTCGAGDEKLAHLGNPEGMNLPSGEKSDRVYVKVSETSVIDVGVLYTPEARSNEGAGTTADMLARINTALTGATQIFKDSNLDIEFRLVKAFELPVNNTAIDLDTISSELYDHLERGELLKVYGVDSLATIVERQSPGAYANIPTRPTSAEGGGRSYFGRSNFSPKTFSHEIGHTLGSYHHRSDQLDLGYTPSPDETSIRHGGHFIGTNNTHYQTLMSGEL